MKKLLTIILSLGFGAFFTAGTAFSQDIRILQVTYAHGFDNKGLPVNPGNAFGPDETVCLHITLDGRPESGVVTARFYWRDQLIDDVAIDLSTIDQEAILTLDNNTVTNFRLRPTKPFPIGSGYRTEVYFNDSLLGTYAYVIVPPTHAVPSAVRKVELAKNIDADFNPVSPTTIFLSNEDVCLVGRGDLGLSTWFLAEWYVLGILDETGTRTLTLAENARDTGFAFSFMPANGWPAGEHFVVLSMNGREVGRYGFTVSGGEPFSAVAIDQAVFAHGFDADGEPLNPGNMYEPGETIYLHLRFKGKPKEGVITGRFYWRDQFIGEKSVDLSTINQGLNTALGQYIFANFYLSPNIPLPVGEGYRMEVFCGAEQLGTYLFYIKPPKGAIPSQVESVTLAKGTDADFNPVQATTTFYPMDRVYLVGMGDFGVGTWLYGEWYVNGRVDESGSRKVTLQDNAPDTGFSFSHLPAGGWPPGAHYAVLLMDGREIGRYAFYVVKENKDRIAD
jgi:hypothetical protein